MNFHRVCSKTSVDLVSVETTSVGSLSKTVIGNCITNAVPSSNSSRLEAVCSSKGEWVVVPGVSFVCKVGYQPSANLQNCLAGTYQTITKHNYT